MALNNNLLVSWNFETVSGSNVNGEFEAADVSTTYLGKGRGFAANSQDFLLKEDILTGKKQHFETLEGTETIQLVDGDDERVTALKKPSSIKLAVENSMYQIVSDEILNYFTTVNTYAFKFTVPDNKYQPEYDKLIQLRKGFFENIDGKPDLERYIEFYKWIDSSLGALIDQLKPENSSDISGLKTTVESHILERNKFQHKLPITIQPNRNYSSGITVIKTNAFDRSAKEQILSDTVEDIVSTENIIGKNYSKNVDFIQTAGKIHNNRDPKTNKTVIQTKFSAGDGLSELNRDASGEFSVYNETNQRAIIQRTAYNISQSADRRINQGTNNPVIGSDFEDNAFIQRNVPYTASNYHQTGVAGYQQFPEGEVADRRSQNILLKNENVNLEVVEPPIQYAVSTKHKIRMDGAFEDMDIESPYYSAIDTFSPRTLNVTGTSVYFDRQNFGRKDDNDTFYRKIDQLSGGLALKRVEVLDNIYPRKDVMGLATIRTKPDYEEASGTFSTSALTWSQNSYNNNSADIRSFWRDSYENRKRTRGVDAADDTGSVSALDSYNLSQSNSYELTNATSYLILTGSSYSGTCDFTTNVFNNYYDLLFATEASSSVTDRASPTIYIDLKSSGYGDISAYSHGELSKFIISSSFVPRAKPTFIFNNFPSYISDRYYYSGGFIFPAGYYPSASFGFNLSYQTGLDERIKPFYDTYNAYFYNIKGKSQAHSVIPEFQVSNFDKLLSQDFSNPYNNGEYLKILGRENSDQYYSDIADSLDIDFNKFFDKDSNKIKFSFSGIKKLLPYNGFYPQQASAKIVNLFSSSYFSGSSLGEAQKQTLLQPLFAPGVLFNTIKAGIAMDYPVCITSSLITTSSIYTNVYSNTSTASCDENIRVIKSGSITDRVAFESLLDPKKFYFDLFSDSSKRLIYLDPTHYSDIFTYNSASSAIIPSASYTDIQNLFINNKDDQYKAHINNFLSEIPNFFLKNNNLTYFISRPESEFQTLTSGSEYSFNIRIRKNDNFSMFKRISSVGSNDLPIESIFGPPTQIKSSVVNKNNLFNRISYYPFCPPYFADRFLDIASNNPSTDILDVPVTISFIADETKKYSLEDIFRSASFKTYIGPEYGPPAYYPYSNGVRTLLENLLNLKNKINSKQITFSTTTGLPTDTVDKDDFRWVIQTKFETPLIDYDDTTEVSSSVGSAHVGTYSSAGTTDTGPLSVEYRYNLLEGIWSSYGNIPKDGQSVQIIIDDDGAENSLLEAVGFRRESKSIGQLATNKTIQEAVVLAPFSIKNRDATILTYNTTEDKYFIKIPESTINKLLKVPNYRLIDRNNNRRMDKIKTILNTNLEIDKSNSIVDLMIKMVNYNIPPHLNWLFDTDIDPFVMYIAEFSHVLSKQDLADIWQGTMPQIAQTPEEQRVTLEHSLGPDQLLGSLDLGKYDLKMKTFKIKYRANGSYYDMLDDIEDNKNYKYVKSDTSIPWYTYNWPYDYFSLVELVNIQGGEVYEMPNFNANNTPVVLTGSFATPVITGFTAS